MATFKIQNQRAFVVQQGESITNNASVIGLRDDLAALRADIDHLVGAGQLDVRTGGEIRTAIEEAAGATDGGGVVRALRRAREIATGITILGGVAESIDHILGLLNGGS